ncbi:MAG: AAA family ATPase, partial [Deltaproteobacteria bacterium]|nr:AAA family ATPase [Deltaproteobacteria bacterium]
MKKTIVSEKKLKRLPGTRQKLQEIISEDRVYVDKTPYIYKMLTELDVYYLFLSRPRRFGKTLLLDTLSELFLGRRHLFENLWIGRETDYDFKPYPVIRLSMNYAKTDTPQRLEKYIIEFLLETAESMDVEITKTEYDSILEELLKKLSRKHGEGAVVLIDEYDAPVARHIDDPDLAQANSKILHGFYTSLKVSEEYIHFVFVTGITRFAMTALDSGPNNFEDISLMPDYGGVCGFTVSEFDRYFGDRMEDLLQAQTESGFMPPDSRVSDLREKILAWYDGYNWLGPERVLNPYAIVNLFSKQSFAKYWVASGQPSHLKAMIRQRPQNFLAPQIEEYFSSEIRKVDLQHLEPAPILFHSGYLTIDREIIHPGDSNADDSDDDEPSYTFKFPNKEVKNGYSGILKDVFGKAGYGSI